MYPLHKDHKVPVPGQEVKGPEARAVCGAREAPNSRLGHFLSMILNDFSDDANHESECASSEEMKAAFGKFNSLEKEVRMRCRIVSMDVKALYPSMRWDLITRAVKKMITKSELEVKNVDYHEVGKFLAIMMSEDEIMSEGLQHVIPKRVNPNTKRVTIGYLHEKNNDEKWIPARNPGRVQKRRMLALAIAIGVEQVMSQHTYKIGDT